MERWVYSATVVVVSSIVVVVVTGASVVVVVGATVVVVTGAAVVVVTGAVVVVVGAGRTEGGVGGVETAFLHAEHLALQLGIVAVHPEAGPGGGRIGVGLRPLGDGGGRRRHVAVGVEDVDVGGQGVDQARRLEGQVAFLAPFSAVPIWGQLVGVGRDEALDAGDPGRNGATDLLLDGRGGGGGGCGSHADGKGDGAQGGEAGDQVLTHACSFQERHRTSRETGASEGDAELAELLGELGLEFCAGGCRLARVMRLPPAGSGRSSR